MLVSLVMLEDLSGFSARVGAGRAALLLFLRALLGLPFSSVPFPWQVPPQSCLEADLGFLPSSLSCLSHWCLPLPHAPPSPGCTGWVLLQDVKYSGGGEDLNI